MLNPVLCIFCCNSTLVGWNRELKDAKESTASSMERHYYLYAQGLLQYLGWLGVVDTMSSHSLEKR